MYKKSTNCKFTLYDALVNESGRIIFGSLFILAIAVVLSAFFSTRNGYNHQKLLYNVMISKHSTEATLCVTECKPLYTYYTHARTQPFWRYHSLSSYSKFEICRRVFSLFLSLCRAFSQSYGLCVHIKSNVSDFP